MDLDCGAVLPDWACDGPVDSAPENPEDLEYSEFRTGLTFAAVREILDHEQSQKYRRGEYMWISRSTVLGRWHEIKRRMWARYQARGR